MRPDKRVAAASSGARIRLTLTIGCGTLGGILMVLQAWLLANVIDRLFLQQAPLADAMPLMWWLVGVFGLRSAVNYFSTVFAGQASRLIRQALRTKLISHLMALGPSYVSGERSGELSNTVTEGVEALDAYIREFLPRISLAAIVPLTILLVVFPADTLTGFVLLFTAPVTPVFMWLIGSTAGKMAEKRFDQLSRLSAHFLDVLQGLTTLKLFGRSRQQIEVIRSVTGDFRHTTMEVLRIAFLSSLVLEIVGTLSTALVAVEVGIRLLYDGLIFRDALFILILAPDFYQPLRDLGSSFHSSTAGSAAAKRIFEVLETPVLQPAPAASTHVQFNQAIRFDNVTVRYREATAPALSNINLAINVGETVAVVGPSGAGKSTLAALLLRFVEPTTGSITVDGMPLTSIPASTWRTQISWVSQRPYLFNTTVADNIAMSRPDASLADIRAAAEAAFANQFISELPDGYNTVVGEQGVRLSGGQMQRVALARAFLRDAPLLILDEATANLDVRTEAQIEQAVQRLMKERTTIIIAHRLNTVASADKILVLQNGQLIEQGSHKQLVADEEFYSTLLAAYQGGA